eukprot:TRINITY_DN6818_c0_g1_i7.p1 TRINITY_DN6818_c0_g1~~TRINITY_DN6818_c0_g1_i7.p1  ORF type:complete len:435 (+),score=66.66 TRINITY_DN6818_c0_g1_i7:114-1307(+)
MVLPAEPATEQTYFEPYGVTHKLLGETLLLPWIQAPAIANRSQTWRCGTGDKTPLSPGLFPSIGQSIRALEAFFFLAGDPVRDYERAESCPLIRARLFELFLANPSGSLEAREDLRCFVTMLPPWLLPLAGSQSSRFAKKVVVFMSDPRYLVMRTAAMWAIVKQCASTHETTPAEHSRLDFLATYLSSEVHLVGEEMQRLSAWALEEEKQPDKVKIFFVEDFVADPETALRGLARFLGVPDFGEEFATAAELLSTTGKTGIFQLRARPESQHSFAIVQEFEEVFTGLPADLQATWASNAERWQKLPNRRMASLGEHLLSHSIWATPHWWIAHTAGLCRPCSFFLQKRCFRADDCQHCHVPGHEERRRRPGKAERSRQKRRFQRSLVDRTPSPCGFSS